MKKLKIKDKKIRINFLPLEDKHFILKAILKNANFLILFRWKAFLFLQKLISKNSSKIACTNRCLLTFNKKRFNKLTCFSRHVFLKLIRSGNIPGITKSSW